MRPLFQRDQAINAGKNESPHCKYQRKTVPDYCFICVTRKNVPHVRLERDKRNRNKNYPTDFLIGKKNKNKKETPDMLISLHLTGSIRCKVSTTNSFGIVAPTIVTCMSTGCSLGGDGLPCRICNKVT